MIFHSNSNYKYIIFTSGGTEKWRILRQVSVLTKVFLKQLLLPTYGRTIYCIRLI